MRFVDVPSSHLDALHVLEHALDEPSMEGAALGFAEAVRVEPSDRRRQASRSRGEDDVRSPGGRRSLPLRVEMPEGYPTDRRSGLGRLIQRLWSSAPGA